MTDKSELTDEQLTELQRVGAGVIVFNPSGLSERRWQPLANQDLVLIEDIGSDESQETTWRVTLTKRGVELLKSHGMVPRGYMGVGERR